MIRKMRAFIKVLVFVFLLTAVAFGVAWGWAGAQPGPVVEIRQPGKFLGRNGSVELMVQAPDGRFSAVDVSVEQNGKTFPVYTLDSQKPSTTKPDAADKMFVSRPIGKQAIPDLQAGPARIVVSARRPVLYGLRQTETTATHDVQVRLDPPRASVVSMFHYINLGGSEFVVYRVTPEDVESGVRVGGIEYPGYPAKGAGITSDPALRVAFFALLFDQDPKAPVELFARDPAGNEVVVPFDHQVFPKPYGKSTIPLDDTFLQRVVPAIASNSPNENIPTNDMLAGFLKINGDLRRKNNQYLMELSKKSAPELFFKDAFQQLGNSQVEAKFADTRTYTYKGQNVDKQVHLGFDLAKTANVSIVASQRGRIVHASDLGIYGNCVVIDHGMGVLSLYGHLSSIGVKVGDTVEKGQELGRSGMTGLAGGDHLHFTMLVGGQQVTPVDWWSTQWMQDRVLRKIAAFGGV
jgi:murein DD-endopeptidase MepM/ murein hydrolase activator NlpD